MNGEVQAEIDHLFHAWSLEDNPLVSGDVACRQFTELDNFGYLDRWAALFEEEDWEWHPDKLGLIEDDIEDDDRIAELSAGAALNEEEQLLWEARLESYSIYLEFLKIYRLQSTGAKSPGSLYRRTDVIRVRYSLMLPVRFSTWNLWRNS